MKISFLSPKSIPTETYRAATSKVDSIAQKAASLIHVLTPLLVGWEYWEEQMDVHSTDIDTGRCVGCLEIASKVLRTHWMSRVGRPVKRNPLEAVIGTGIHWDPDALNEDLGYIRRRFEAYEDASGIAIGWGRGQGFGPLVALMESFELWHSLGDALPVLTKVVDQYRVLIVSCRAFNARLDEAVPEKEISLEARLDKLATDSSGEARVLGALVDVVGGWNELYRALTHDSTVVDAPESSLAGLGNKSLKDLSGTEKAALRSQFEKMLGLRRK